MDAAVTAAWAQVVFAGVLVAVTIYYAIQNRNMAREMRHARELSVAPQVTLDLHSVGRKNKVVALRNAGQGAALDLDGTLRFHVREGQRVEAHPRLERHVQIAYLAPREMEEFLPPANAHGDWDFEAIAALLDRITFDGTVTDSLGATREVNIEICDLDERHQRLAQAHRRYNPPALERIHDEIKKIREAVEPKR